MHTSSPFLPSADKQFPVEQFEATVYQSTVTFPPLKGCAEAAIAVVLPSEERHQSHEEFIRLARD